MNEKRDTWLILREPGCVPERKGPFAPTDLANTLREFMKARPTASITVLTWDATGDPSVEDGPECLSILDGRSASIAAKHRASTRAAFLAEARRS